MTTEKKMREAMACLHAADDLCERVLAAAAGAPRRRAGHALPLAAAVAILGVALLVTGGTAYAVLKANADFFERIWGDNGLGERVDWSFTEKGTTHSFSRSFSTLDPTELGGDFENAAQGVGLSVEGNGYTLLVESIIVDANGCGAVTMRLSSPDGVKCAPQYGAPGELVLNDEHEGGIDTVVMDIPSDGFASANHELIRDEERSTDTELVFVMYFDARRENFNEMMKGVCWGLSWHEGEGDGTRYFDAETALFHPAKVVDTVSFVDGETKVNLSPLSIHLALAGSDKREVIVDCVSLMLSDGSEVVIKDDGAGIMNYYTGTVGNDGTTAFTLTQPVDPSKVERVLVQARDYEDDGRTRIDNEYVLTPR